MSEQRLSDARLRELLRFLSIQKRYQDTFYGEFEILSVDPEAEIVEVRRVRPAPNEPVVEKLHFDFLERFWNYHHAGRRGDMVMSS